MNKIFCRSFVCLTTALLIVSGFFVFANSVLALAIISPATGGSAIPSNTVGGTYTSLTGPAIIENASGDIGTGNIILNAPAGFIFDIGGTAPTIRVDCIGGCLDNTHNINNATSGNSVSVTSITTTQITKNITQTTNSGVTNSLTWQNVRVRPTAVSPLAVGNITESGASILGVNSSTNFGTLNEIDKTPPTVGAVTVSPLSKFYSGTPNYVGTGITISAQASEVSTITGEYTMDGGANWHTATCDQSTQICSQTISSGINTGASYTFNFKVTDSSGNVGIGTALTAVGDITNPTVTINSPATGAVTNGAMNFKYTPADVGSGLATCDLYSNYPAGGATVVYRTNSSPVNGTENTFAITGLTTAGNYLWDVQCADKVGQNGVSQDWSTHRTFIVDRTPPVIVTHADVTATADSLGGATVSYTLPATSDNVDAPGTATCLPASGSKFSLGTTTVHCNATDTAGNSATPTSFTVTVNVGPVSAGKSTVVASASSTIASTPIIVTITAEDAFGNIIPGISKNNISISANPSTGVTYDPASANALEDTNSSGQTTAQFTSSASGIYVVTATIDGVSINQKPSVTFAIGSPALAVITATPATQEANLLGASVNLDVLITDGNHNPVNDGIAVTVTPSSGNVTGEGTTLAGHILRVLTFNNKDTITLVVSTPAVGIIPATGDTTIYFVDRTKPVITRTGSGVVTVEYRGTYTDLGATALDNIDGDITSHIVTVNPVDTNTVQFNPAHSGEIVATYTVTYDVVDGSENHADQVTRTVNVVDSTKPIISSITSNATASGALKIGDKINFVLTPALTEPIATVSGSYNGQALVWSIAGAGTTYTATYTVTEGDSDQTTPLQITGVTMTDEAGNISNPASGTDVLKTIDAHKPTLTSVHIESSNARNNLAKIGDTVTLTFSSSEAVSTPTVKIAGNSATVEGGPTSWTAIYVMQLGDTEGKIPFSIGGFADLAGNGDGTTTATTDVSSVTFDKTAPVISEKTPVVNPTNDSTPNYVFNSTEAGTIGYSGSCASSQALAVYGDNTVTFNHLADGIYTNCVITVTDATGNTSTNLLVKPFTVDTVLPIVSVETFPTVNIANKTAVTISGTCSEEGLPVLIVVGSVNDSSKNCVTGAWSYTKDLSSLADGTLTATASQIDVATNTGSGSKNAIKDTVVPLVIGLANDSNPTKSKIWNWDSNETGSTFRYLIDTNPTWSSPTGDFGSVATATQLNGDGTYYIHVQAKDAVGNIGDVVSVSAVLDNTAPVIVNTPSDMIGVIANATGGANNVTYTNPTATDNIDGTLDTVICLPASGSFFPLGSTTVNCNVTDKAGNSAIQTSFAVTVIPDTITHFVLTASPASLKFGGDPSVITVTGKDQYENRVTNNNSTIIELSVVSGDGNLDTTTSALSSGVMTSNLSSNSVGSVGVRAESSGIDPKEVTVEFTEADTSAPFVQSTSPANTTTGVAVNVQPYLIFSEPLAASTVTSANVYLQKSDGSTVPAVVSMDFMEGKQRVIITPASPLDFSAKYYFVVTAGVTDLVGNPATPTATEYSFTTVADTTILKVTGISAVKTYATADNTYENGWSWKFNVTVPTTEPNLQMKFADWTTTLPNTIPVAGNVRYSSAQASNGPIEITSANTYGDLLHINGDLDSSMAGLQIEILVEAKVPTGSAGGSYSTSYGINSLATSPK